MKNFAYLLFFIIVSTSCKDQSEGETVPTSIKSKTYIGADLSFLFPAEWVLYQKPQEVMSYLQAQIVAPEENAAVDVYKMENVSSLKSGIEEIQEQLKLLNAEMLVDSFSENANGFTLIQGKTLLSESGFTSEWRGKFIFNNGVMHGVSCGQLGEKTSDRSQEWDLILGTLKLNRP